MDIALKQSRQLVHFGLTLRWELRKGNLLLLDRILQLHSEDDATAVSCPERQWHLLCIPASHATVEGIDKIDGVADAPLPLAGDLHAGVTVVNDEESSRRQLEIVLLLEVLRRPEQRGT